MDISRIYELKDIQIVAAIARYGGINHAARHLGITQPALTKRIKGIENRIGYELFDRLPRGMQLTASGQVFLAEGEKLIVHANDFSEKLNSHRAGNDGHVSFGVKPGLNEVFFRETVIEFSARYPDATLNIELDSTPTLCRMLRNGRIDFAFGAPGYTDENGNDAVKIDGLQFEPLYQLPLLIVVRKGHPVLKSANPERDLFQYPVAVPTAPDNIARNFATGAGAFGRKFTRPQIRIDDYDLILQLVEVSDFWTGIFEPNKASIEETGKFDFIHAPKLTPPMLVGVIHRESWSYSPAALNLIEIAKSKSQQWRVD